MKYSKGRFQLLFEQLKVVDKTNSTICVESHVNFSQVKTQFKRRTFHVPNLMLMSKILCSNWFAFDSALEKFNVWTGSKLSPDWLIGTMLHQKTFSDDIRKCWSYSLKTWSSSVFLRWWKYLDSLGQVPSFRLVYSGLYQRKFFVLM